MQTTSTLWRIGKILTESAMLIAAMAIWIPLWSILLFFWEITHI